MNSEIDLFEKRVKDISNLFKRDDSSLFLEIYSCENPSNSQLKNTITNLKNFESQSRKMRISTTKNFYETLNGKAFNYLNFEEKLFTHFFDNKSPNYKDEKYFYDCKEYINYIDSFENNQQTNQILERPQFITFIPEKMTTFQFNAVSCLYFEIFSTYFKFQLNSITEIFQKIFNLEFQQEIQKHNVYFDINICEILLGSQNPLFEDFFHEFCLSNEEEKIIHINSFFQNISRHENLVKYERAELFLDITKKFFLKGLDILLKKLPFMLIFVSNTSEDFPKFNTEKNSYEFEIYQILQKCKYFNGALYYQAKLSIDILYDKIDKRINLCVRTEGLFDNSILYSCFGNITLKDGFIETTIPVFDAHYFPQNTSFESINNHFCTQLQKFGYNFSIDHPFKYDQDSSFCNQTYVSFIKNYLVYFDWLHRSIFVNFYSDNTFFKFNDKVFETNILEEGLNALSKKLTNLGLYASLFTMYQDFYFYGQNFGLSEEKVFTNSPDILLFLCNKKSLEDHHLPEHILNCGGFIFQGLYCVLHSNSHATILSLTIIIFSQTLKKMKNDIITQISTLNLTHLKTLVNNSQDNHHGEIHKQTILDEIERNFLKILIERLSGEKINTKLDEIIFSIIRLTFLEHFVDQNMFDFSSQRIIPLEKYRETKKNLLRNNYYVLYIFKLLNYNSKFIQGLFNIDIKYYLKPATATCNRTSQDFFKNIQTLMNNDR